MMEMRGQMEQQLKRMKLPGILNNLDLRVAEAQENRLGYLEFLGLLLQDEILSREANNLTKRIKAAGFGNEKTFEGYDFQFNEEELPASMIRDLGSCHFVEQKRNLVITGPPGIGKTHIGKAIGHEVCRRGHDVMFRKTHALLNELRDEDERKNERIMKQCLKAEVLILDDFAFRRLDQQESELLYTIADERITKASTILTSNRPPQDWYGIFPDPVIGGAILDRFVSGAIKVVVTRGRSYRKERAFLPSSQSGEEGTVVS